MGPSPRTGCPGAAGVPVLLGCLRDVWASSCSSLATAPPRGAKPVGFVCPWEVLKPLSCSPKIPKFSKTPRRDGARGAQREGWVWSLIWADGRGGGVGAGT